MKWAALAIVTIGVVGLVMLRTPAPVEPPVGRGVAPDNLSPLTAGVFAHVDRDDYTTTERGIKGSAGELGSHLDIYWDALNPSICGFGTPAPGCMDYNAIDDALAAAASQEIALVDGTTIDRPIWLTLPVFWTQHPTVPYTCANDIPSYIPTPYAPTVRPPTPAPPAATYTPHPEVVPPFDTAAFTDAYTQTIKLLGQRYNGDSRLTGVFLALGYNNEAGLNGDWCGTGQAVANDYITDYAGGEYDLFVRAAINAAHTAFPDKLVFVLDATAPDNVMRCNWVDGVPGVFTGIGEYETHHVGLGFNGLAADVPAYARKPPAQATPRPCDAFAVRDRWADALPTKMEPARLYDGLVTAQRRSLEYWGTLMGLGAWAPVFVDWSPSWFCMDVNPDGSCGSTDSEWERFNDDYNFPRVTTAREGADAGDFGSWIERQYRQTAYDATDLWTAFHVTEFPYGGSYCGFYCEGINRNYTHYLTPAQGTYQMRCADNDTGGGVMSCATSPAMPESPYSRFAGQMTGTTLSFGVDAGMLQYYGATRETVIRVAYLNEATTDFCVEYVDETGSIQQVTVDRTAAGTWAWLAIEDQVRYTNDLDGGVVRVRYGVTGCSPGQTTNRPTLHMVWLDVTGGGVATATPTSTLAPTLAPTSTPTPPAGVSSLYGLVVLSEISPDTTHDWRAVGAADYRSTFIEALNTTTQTVDCTACSAVVASGGVTLTASLARAEMPAGGYVVVAWGDDLGAAAPVTGTVTLWDGLGLEIASQSVGSAIGPGLSLGWNGAAWVTGLPSPGQGPGYWTSVPTPTSWPTAAPTNTPTAAATSTPTAAPTNTPTAAPTSTPTATATATWTPTHTATSTATWTPTHTATSTATWTPTHTATSTATWTPTHTATSTATWTATATATPTPTATWTPTATPTSAATFLNLQVNASTDDADQQEFGTMYRAGCTSDSSAGNACVKTGNVGTTSRYWGGLRFNAVTIPQGTTILTATLEFYVTSSTYDDPKFDIYGQAADNPGTFQATAHDIDGRSRTTAYTTWSADGIGTGWVTGPDIATVLQEIIDRPGWVSGNSLVLILKPYDAPAKELRWRSYDSGDGAAVRLHVKW